VNIDSDLSKIDYVMFQDVALEGDQKDFLDECEHAEQAQKSLGAKRTLLGRACSRSFVKKPGPKAKAKAKAKAKPGPKAAAAKPKWKAAATSADAEFFLNAWKPPQSKIVIDPSNGRYLMHYPGFSRRSVSWTQRGHQVAVQQCFGILSKWHAIHTGQNLVMPPDLVS